MSYKARKIVFAMLPIMTVLIYGGIYFYPAQIMPIAHNVDVTTPQFEKYHNDCLHPCIRIDTVRRIYWMVQSPYYEWNSEVENPILYSSCDLDWWKNGVEVAETPEYGFNSDPNIYLTKDTVFVFWREFATPLCDSIGVCEATVGVFTTDGAVFSKKKVYLSNEDANTDAEQAPTLVYFNGRYRFYATWYQYIPERKNKGIAIWEGTSLTEPDFKLVDTVEFKPIYTVDKLVQKRLLGKIWYVPKPLRYDLWHFDIVEYDGKLLMVSSSEKGDNIMLSVSEDGIHFKTRHTPLVNNHYSENHTGYRQYYYKPTAIIENDTLHLFYTTNNSDFSLNILQHTQIPVNEL